MADEVALLTARLEASGLGAFTTNMAAADKATANVRSNLVGMTAASEGSTVATRNLGAASLTASQHHAKNAQELNSMERSARGGIASFTGLGRAMFFASNAFLGGALIGGVLKSIVDKTRTTEDAMGQLQVAVKNTGNSWDVMGGQIDSMLKKQGDASLFMKSDLATSMTRFVLSTGSVTKATTELSIATNLARLRHEDLATATMQVIQAGLGHVTVLRGLGVAIPKVTTNVDELKAAILRAKNAHEAYAPAAVAAAMATARLKDMSLTGAEALKILADKTKGANATFEASSAGALARFHHSLDELQLTMGAVLVPQITKVVNALSGWMDKMDKSGRLTADLQQGISILKTAFSALGDVIHTVDGITGSFKATLEVVATMMIGSKLLGGFKAITVAAGESGAAGAIGLLRTRLLALSKLAATAIVITIAYDIVSKAHTTATGLHRYSGSAGWGNLWHDIVGNIKSGAAGLTPGGTGLGQFPGGAGAAGMGTPGALNGLQSGGAANASAGKGKMLALAQSMLGTPYAWGGAGPGGFDCSGLVQWAFANGLNVSIPRTTYGQVTKGIQTAAGTGGGVTSGKLGVGNVVFTNYGEGGNSGPGHEGLVVGFDKNGQPIIESAPHTGAKVQNSSLAGFTGGAYFTARNLLGKGGMGGGIDLTHTSTTGIASLLGGTHSTLKPHKPKAFKIPDVLEAHIRAAQQAFADNVTKQHLDTLDSLLAQEVTMLKSHGQLAKAQSVQNEIDNANKKFAAASIVIGDALLSAALKAKMKKITTQFSADSDYATVLVGDTADKYRAVLQKDLLSQNAVLTAEANSLKSKLASATGKQKAAIQTELTKVQASITSVQQSILQGLDANVQSLQSKVATLFGNVTQQFDDALGKLFFQNGMKTVLEQQLADMQAQDQLSSLTDSIQQAKDQLKTDQTGALAGVQFNAATGLTKNLYNASSATQLAADQKAIDAAQRQLDEYNLGIKAAAERASMDAQYTEQVTTLNAKLAKLGEAFQNGTGSMQALRDLASQYGIVISTSSIPDFKDLSSASNDLKQAFIDLVNYIGTITGVTPKITAGGGGGGSAGGAVAGSPAATLQNLHAQVVNGIISPETYHYMISGHKLQIPGMASGGIVRAKPGGTIVRLAEGGQDEQVGPVGGRSGGGDVHVHFDGPVYGTNADELARLLTPKIKSELLRDQKRNANTTGIK